MPIDTPVAFCVFNRPDLAEIVLREIARARPRRLLVFSDGPRADRPGEAERIEQSRRLLERVDWNCDVETVPAVRNGNTVYSRTKIIEYWGTLRSRSESYGSTC